MAETWTRYRKKPVVINAQQWNGGHHEDAQALLEAIGAEDKADAIECMEGKLYLHTLEGWMGASVGDYIIRGVQGEIYACKPDIFESTYEPAD